MDHEVNPYERAVKRTQRFLDELNQLGHLTSLAANQRFTSIEVAHCIAQGWVVWEPGVGDLTITDQGREELLNLSLGLESPLKVSARDWKRVLNRTYPPECVCVCGTTANLEPAPVGTRYWCELCPDGGFKKRSATLSAGGSPCSSLASGAERRSTSGTNESS